MSATRCLDAATCRCQCVCASSAVPLHIIRFGPRSRFCPTCWPSCAAYWALLRTPFVGIGRRIHPFLPSMGRPDGWNWSWMTVVSSPLFPLTVYRVPSAPILRLSTKSPWMSCGSGPKKSSKTPIFQEWAFFCCPETIDKKAKIGYIRSFGILPENCGFLPKPRKNRPKKPAMPVCPCSMGFLETGIGKGSGDGP